jgi:hypothetical protein
MGLLVWAKILFVDGHDTGHVPAGCANVACEYKNYLSASSSVLLPTFKLRFRFTIPKIHQKNHMGAWLLFQNTTQVAAYPSESLELIPKSAHDSSSC